MITHEKYLYAVLVFKELTDMVDQKRLDWFRQFGSEMPDDYIRLETVQVIDNMFAIMVKYRKQQKQRAGN
jgi:hypothetical protein